MNNIYKINNEIFKNVNPDNCYNEDFYKCINKTWIENTTIPDDTLAWGTFEILENTMQTNLLKIIQGDPSLNIIFTQYNNKNIESSFILLNKIINILNDITDKTIFLNTIMVLYLIYEFPMFLKIDIEPYIYDSKVYIPYIVQPNISLPLIFYTNDNNISKTHYIEYVKQYSSLFGLNINGNLIYDIDQELYSNIKTLNEIEINLMNYDDFIKNYPNLSFISMIYKYTNTKPNLLNIFNKKYLNKLNKLIEIKTLDEWRKYIIFKIIEKYNFCFSDEIEKYTNSFIYNLKFSIQLNYNKKYKTEKIIKYISYYLSDTLGEKYLLYNKFNIEIINLTNLIIEHLKTALLSSIKNNSWMTEVTKTNGINKLNNLSVSILNKIINGKSVLLNEKNSFLKNILKSSKRIQKKRIQKIYFKLYNDIIDSPVYDINAFYVPSYNKIIIPIGILSEPFISINQSITHNFAGIGIILGHEIIHGFDTNGNKYDKHGNYYNWWNSIDTEIYNKLVNKFKEQFKNKNIDINFTIDENLADLGGINIAVKALTAYLDNMKILDKKEEYKKFFIHYATIWKYKTSKDDLHTILNDEHATPIIRVNNMLNNIDEFYYAFDIVEGNELYLSPQDRITIW